MSDPIARDFYRALGGFPWLVQTLAGVTEEDLARWHARTCPGATKADKWAVARAMLTDFIPTAGEELVSMFLRGFVLPSQPMMLPDQERSVLFVWAPELGRWPNGILTQVALAVKRGTKITDMAGEFDFIKWRAMVDFNEGSVVDFLIVPEIQ